MKHTHTLLTVLLLAPLVTLHAADAQAKNPDVILLEAEQFADPGGWDTDQ